MPDSWQELDGDGVLMDWTSADTLKLCDLWHPIEALRRAYNERYYARPLGAWANVIPEQARLKDIYSACLVIHNAITGLFGNEFEVVNYTQGNPNYNNKTSLPLISTMASALTIIGDSSRVTVTRLKDIAPWLIQSRKLINICKWFRPLITTPAAQATKAGYSYDVSGSASAAYSAAVTNWQSASWGSAERLAGLVEYTQLQSTTSWNAGIQVTRSNPFQWGAAVGWHSSAIASVDLYGIPQRVYGDQGVYYDGVYPYENKLNLVKNYSEQSMVDFNTNNTSYLLEDQQPSTPTQWADISTQWVYFSCEPFRAGGTAVVKFDGPNGFKFKDW